MSTGFTATPRYTSLLQIFSTAHAQDPSGESASYHSTLQSFVRQLYTLSTDERLSSGPTEAILISSACQHLRRWEKPRSDYPEGLANYKMWRTRLNKWHYECCVEAMKEVGYEVEEGGKDEELVKRCETLLLKKTLGRPPVTLPLKDPEMNLFEDAICLTFLALQFGSFADKLDDADKLVVIVRKTWAKMTPDGQGIVAREMVGGLPESLKEVVGRALAE